MKNALSGLRIKMNSPKSGGGVSRTPLINSPSVMGRYLIDATNIFRTFVVITMTFLS
jgi:hypothetical protein